jgi:hypothetical protein
MTASIKKNFAENKAGETTPLFLISTCLLRWERCTAGNKERSCLKKNRFSFKNY